MKTKDIMIKDIVKVDSYTSVHDVVKIMNRKSIGCVIVVDNGEPEGIVTERDLLQKVLEKTLDPRKLKISNIMTRNLVLGEPDMEIHEAAKLMFKRKIKKLLIVEAGKLVGLITLTNIARTAGRNDRMTEIVEKLYKMHPINTY